MASSHGDGIGNIFVQLTELYTMERKMSISTELAALSTQITSFPHFESVQDPELAVAVIEAKAAAENVFIFARSYINKVHSVAKYICDEKDYTIKAVEEGNAKELEEYFSVVRSQLNECKEYYDDLQETSKAADVSARVERTLRLKEDEAVQAKRAAKEKRFKDVLDIATGAVTDRLFTALRVIFEITNADSNIYSEIIRFCSEMRGKMKNVMTNTATLKSKYGTINIMLGQVMKALDTMEGKDWAKICDSSKRAIIKVNLETFITECRNVMEESKELKGAKNLDEFIKKCAPERSCTFL